MSLMILHSQKLIWTVKKVQDLGLGSLPMIQPENESKGWMRSMILNHEYCESSASLLA